MPISRRILLYLFGVGLGLIMVFYLFRGRQISWLPESVIKEKVQKLPVDFSDMALCRMKCLDIEKSEVQELLLSGKVNFKKSDVRKKPCKNYVFEKEWQSGHGHPELLRALLEVCEKHVKVLLVEVEKNTENCKCN